MAENTNDTTEDLNTLSPLVAGAAGNNVNQAKMAGTAQTKQGVAGIPSSTVRGNVHEVPSSKPSVWSAPQPAQVVTQKETKTEGLSDIDRTKLVTESKKQNAEDKRLAQENLEKSQSLSQLGAVGESIKRVLQGNINQIFDAKGALQGDGLAAIGSSEVLMGDLRKGVSAKAKYVDATGKEIVGDDAVNAIMRDITDADALLDAVDGRAKTTGAVATDEADSLAATEKMNKAISALALSMGDADGNVSFDTLKNIFPDEQKLLGTLASSSLADKVLVDDKLMTQMFTDEDGVPDQAELDKVKGMLGLTGKETVTELRQKIDNYMGTEFKDITDLEDVLRDETRSPEERRQALEQLRDKGYTGAMASREEVTQTADTIRDFDEGAISFLGNTYGSLSEALSDDSIMGAVSDYLNDNLDREKIPGPLADFIDANRKTFSAAITEMEKEIGDFNSRQEQWKEIESLFPAGDASNKAILDMLGFKPGQPYQTGILNVSKIPALNAIVNKEEPAATNARAFLTNMQANKIDPATTQQILNNLSTDDIAKLAADPDTQKDYINSAAFSNKLKKIIEFKDDNNDGKNDLSGMDVLSQVFGAEAGGTIADLSSAMSDFELMKGVLPPDMVTALESSFTLLGELGNISDPVKMKAALTQLVDNLPLGNVDAFKNATSIGDVLTSLGTKLDAAVKAFGGKTGTMRPLADLVRKVKSGETPTTTLEGGRVVPTLLYTAEQAGLIKPVNTPDGQSNAGNLKSTMDFINKLDLTDAQKESYRNTVLDGAFAQVNELITNTSGRFNPAGMVPSEKAAFSSAFATFSQAAANGVQGAGDKLKTLMSSTLEKRLSPSWGDISALGTKVGGAYIGKGVLTAEEMAALGVNPKDGFLNSNLGAGGYKPARQSLLEGYATYTELLGLPQSGTGFGEYIAMLKSTRGSVI